MFYEFWVEELWGNQMISLIATAGFLALIGMFGRFSTYLLLALMGLYFMVFGTLFFGLIVWFPVMVLSFTYLFIQTWNYLQR